nr:MAG TPA: Pyocin activator protein PrtN [Caudoviricetes sp.]
MNKGQLPYLILGKGNGSRKVRGSDLEKFIESQKPAEPQGGTE